MGFYVTCPTCGPRSYHEYWFGGEVRERSMSSADEADYRAVWLRENAAGLQRERWFHYAGCRRWLTLQRDTQDNSIARDELPAESP